MSNIVHGKDEIFHQKTIFRVIPDKIIFNFKSPKGCLSLSIN